MRIWVYNPHTGGKSIPPAVQTRTERRILDYAAKHHAGKFTRIDVRFRGALCYIDVYTEPVACRGEVPPGRDAGTVDRAAPKYAHTSLPDSILRERRPLEFRLVYLRPREVRTQLLDHRRRSRHTRRSLRDVSPVLLTMYQAFRDEWNRQLPLAKLCFQSGQTMGEGTN